eukprot:Gb_19933 [translate_table: standard]
MQAALQPSSLMLIPGILMFTIWKPIELRWTVRRASHPTTKTLKGTGTLQKLKVMYYIEMGPPLAYSGSGKDATILQKGVHRSSKLLPRVPISGIHPGMYSSWYLEGRSSGWIVACVSVRDEYTVKPGSRHLFMTRLKGISFTLEAVDGRVQSSLWRNMEENMQNQDPLPWVVLLPGKYQGFKAGSFKGRAKIKKEDNGENNKSISL